ncbi:MAG: hypothetical protein RLZZ400_530 [Actinomycetota bacterium]
MDASLLSSIKDTAAVVSIPMRSRFRGVTEREALLFEGPNGWAEWAPFLEYEDEEASVWLNAAVEFAFEPEPQLKRTRIGVNATLGAVAADKVADSLSHFGTFATVKIKVAEPGQSIDEDVARVVRVRELYADAKIRLDANGGFEIAQAIELVSELHRRGIELEYFEQPCRTIADLAELRVELHREGLSLAIAADESVRKASDPLAVAQAGAADILVLKVAPLGGVSRALSIASDAGLPIVVSSALDTSVGISAGLQLAAALPELSFDCGLATTAMLIGDVTKEPLRAENGYLDYRRVEVAHSKLDVFRAEDHRVDWWMDRLERCARL